jgi:Zn-dependent protease
MSVLGFYKRRLTGSHLRHPGSYRLPLVFVFLLSVWLIASNLERGGIYVGAVKLLPVSTAAAWLLAIISTFGLFLSVFGHELSHALMGRAEGIEIDEIVLHPFGGLARLRSEPESPGAEFRIAVAGPAASFVFAIVGFLLMVLAMKLNYSTAAGVLFLISSGNLLLAIFNLFPGYPLDGGRVLRAILWRRTGNMTQATRLADVWNADRRDPDHLRRVHGHRSKFQILFHGIVVCSGWTISV